MSEQPIAREAAVAMPWHPLRDRLRLLMLLGSIAAVLALIDIFTVLPLLKPPDAVPKGERLLHFDAAKINGIETTLGRRSVRLEKGASGWEAVSPGARDSVPDERATELLDALRDTTVLASIAAEQGRRGEFGLDPPKGSITLHGDREEIQIVLGDRNPTLTGLYVLVPPRADVLLVGAVLLWEMEKVLALGATP